MREGTEIAYEDEDPGPLREFLTFTLGAEEYAVDILKVKEIRAYEKSTTLANAPAFIKGVINLRGMIVPVVDLRIRFNAAADYTDFTVVIVLNIQNRVVGMVVDGVVDVVAFHPHRLHPWAGPAAAVDDRYIDGLVVSGGRTSIVLDIERLMLSSEMALLDEPAPEFGR
ncbi:chemotaxis protein CheW [Denitratisoma sp. DHT3]|uniref:chemotaxis protein CheW n=1 Tax=Denitratisoma sp. DHT3 TaxID=1981880 RepID=UPI0011987532|nr:chemotaxis protein CheW [Denitratisoma sp. DHT3]QDX81383.1 chemotaxis protein CheW [Denitratisoma sp. DHT3]